MDTRADGEEEKSIRALSTLTLFKTGVLVCNTVIT